MLYRALAHHLERFLQLYEERFERTHGRLRRCVEMAASGNRFDLGDTLAKLGAETTLSSSEGVHDNTFTGDLGTVEDSAPKSANTYQADQIPWSNRRRVASSVLFGPQCNAGAFFAFIGIAAGMRIPEA